MQHRILHGDLQPVLSRLRNAPRMVTAMVIPVPVSPSEIPGFTG
jgi:hypothetical protein